MVLAMDSKRLELETMKMEEENKRHEEMMLVMQQQQQQKMETMQMMMLQQQQQMQAHQAQQNEMILKLFGIVTQEVNYYCISKIFTILI